MKALTKTLRRRDQKGATIIEYILIAALLSIAAIVTLGPLGTTIQTKFGDVDAEVTGAGG